MIPGQVAYVFTAVADAQAAQTMIDTAQGYPVAGLDVGGGLHVPPAQSVTTSYAHPFVNPTTGLAWAMPSDAVTDRVIGGKTVNGHAVPLPAPLDSTWASATVGVGGVTV